MKIFSPITLKWWEVSIFKLCLLSLGIIVGINWFEYFENNMAQVWVLFLASFVSIFYIWRKQKKTE